MAPPEPAPAPPAGRLEVRVGDAALEVFLDEAAGAGAPLVCAAHPADSFGLPTAALLGAGSGARIACVNPRGLGGSSPPPARYTLEAMVDDLEAVRQQLGLGPWSFWGMSGGGWLALLYAHRHPQALRGLIIESACACFRSRLADPACALSPFHPPWRDGLAEAGLLSETAHEPPSAGQTYEWLTLPGVGLVFRKHNGPALLVAPAPLSPEMLHAMPVLYEFDARPWLASLRLPTLVLAGCADPLVPLSHARAVHDAIAGSSFVAIEGGGHVPSAQGSPQAAESVRSFLLSTHSL